MSEFKNQILYCILIIIAPLALNSANRDDLTINEKISLTNLTGISYWIVNLYNSDRIMFAIVSIIIMTIIGAIIGFVTDRILKFFKVEVKSMIHHE